MPRAATCRVCSHSSQWHSTALCCCMPAEECDRHLVNGREAQLQALGANISVCMPSCRSIRFDQALSGCYRGCKLSKGRLFANAALAPDGTRTAPPSQDASLAHNRFLITRAHPPDSRCSAVSPSPNGTSSYTIEDR